MRPVSEAGTESDEREKVHSLRLVYRTVGEGTRELAGLCPGEQVRVLGILGNGYDVSLLEGKRVLLMAGGIGAPPMLGLARECHRRNADVTAVLGYRSQPLFLKEEFESYGKVIIATDDGSAGVRGTVLNAAEAWSLGKTGQAPENGGPDTENGQAAETAEADLAEGHAQVSAPFDVICACGPLPMLRGVKALSEKWQVPCYLSMEEHMACGVGACLGCVVKTVHNDAHSQVNNARICTEGPVFNAEEIVF